MIFIILQTTAGYQPNLKNEVRKLYPCVGRKITAVVVLPNSPSYGLYKHITRIFLAIVKLQTDKESCSVSMRLRKMYSKITNVANKHSFQRADPRGLWCDWQSL